MNFATDFKKDFEVFKRIIGFGLLSKEEAKTLTGIFLGHASDLVEDEKHEHNLHRRTLRVVYNKYPDLRSRDKNDNPK